MLNSHTARFFTMCTNYYYYDIIIGKKNRRLVVVVVVVWYIPVRVPVLYMKYNIYKRHQLKTTATAKE